MPNPATSNKNASHQPEAMQNQVGTKEMSADESQGGDAITASKAATQSVSYCKTHPRSTD